MHCLILCARCSSDVQLVLADIALTCCCNAFCSQLLVADTEIWDAITPLCEARAVMNPATNTRSVEHSDPAVLHGHM